MIDTSKLAPDELARHFSAEAYDEPDTEPVHGTAIPALVVALLALLAVFGCIGVAHLIARITS